MPLDELRACHATVGEDWMEEVGPADEIQTEMFDLVADHQKSTSPFRARTAWATCSIA
jgi:hypothetical protein